MKRDWQQYSSYNLFLDRNCVQYLVAKVIYLVAKVIYLVAKVIYLVAKVIYLVAKVIYLVAKVISCTICPISDLCRQLSSIFRFY